MEEIENNGTDEGLKHRGEGGVGVGSGNMCLKDLKIKDDLELTNAIVQDGEIAMFDNYIKEQRPQSVTHLQIKRMLEKDSSQNR